MLAAGIETGGGHDMRRVKVSLSWSPTIAMSWLWGLGFFYSMHVAMAYGWLGFFAFAIPNAIGLFLFGHVLESRGNDPGRVFGAIQGTYMGLLLAAQVFAVAVTAFAFTRYVASSLLGPGAAVMTVMLLLVSCAVGRATTLVQLRKVHAAYLCAGVAAAALAFPPFGDAPVRALPPGDIDALFLGLVLPTLIGFLLGPWLDVQQWHRAVEIRRAGGSVRASYAAGAAGFFVLLVINAALARAWGGEGAVASDGIVNYHGSAVAAMAGSWHRYALLAWAAIAAVSTFDGAYQSIRWMTSSVLTKSNAPLLAFVPASLVGSPVWPLLAACIAWAAASQAGLSMMYLMLPYATLLTGGGACLVAEVFGLRSAYDRSLCWLLGLASALAFVVGYTQSAWLLALSPLLGLAGALPTVARRMAGGQEAPSPAVTAPAPAFEPEHVVALPPPDRICPTQAHGFEQGWYVMRLTPTYDDTNSVGNVYFANYVRWVGKCRELFFNACMPDFDLHDTSFYVLTKSFQHDFKRETKEFEDVLVKLRIGSHNRKFVTLLHEVHGLRQGLLGKGEQSLMFVDSKTYRPLDIPRSIVSGFLPHWPKESPLTLRPVADGALAG